MVARIDHACLRWRKSTHSGQGTNCVELARLGVGIGDGSAVHAAVRDSKDPHGPALVFTPAELGEFLGRVKTSTL